MPKSVVDHAVEHAVDTVDHELTQLIAVVHAVLKARSSSRLISLKLVEKKIFLFFPLDR